MRNDKTVFDYAARLAAILIFMLAGIGIAHAQTPVNIRAVGDTSIGTTVPVSGAVTVTQCTSATCTSTVVQPTGSNLHVAVDTVPTVVVVNGALTTAYAGTAGMTSITSGGTSQMTATTTNVPSIECANVSSAGANTVTIMDGNGKYFLGPNFSIPAVSNVVMNWFGGARFTSGINISAGASNVIQCEVSPGSTQ